MTSGENEQALTVWIFLRALALVYLCAFLSLATQILGLVGSHGILPAHELLQAVANSEGLSRYWDMGSPSPSTTFPCWQCSPLRVFVPSSFLPRDSSGCLERSR